MNMNKKISTRIENMNYTANSDNNSSHHHCSLLFISNDFDPHGLVWCVVDKILFSFKKQKTNIFYVFSYSTSSADIFHQNNQDKNHYTFYLLIHPSVFLIFWFFSNFLNISFWAIFTKCKVTVLISEYHIWFQIFFIAHKTFFVVR